MYKVNTSAVRDAVDKAVKVDLADNGWPTYKNYEIRPEGEEVFVVASMESVEKPRGVKTLEDGRKVEAYWMGDPSEDAMTIYAPLRTPELLLDLAAMADKPITPTGVKAWAEVYGLLGLPEEDSVETQNGVYRINGGGRRESVSRFAQAAGELRTCLRGYEAAVRGGDIDLDELAASTGPLPREILRSWERRDGEERSWMFGVVARMIQFRLRQYCYPKMASATRDGAHTGEFALTWGFVGLIGAVWLHMALLLQSEGERITWCKLPDCSRVISFETGAGSSGTPAKNARREHKTRSDRIFCKDRACKQKYHYRKKAGWPGYS